MALVRWEPARELASMEIDRLNRMFANLYGDTLGRGWMPAVDIYETDEPRGRAEGRAPGHEARRHQHHLREPAC